jgi:hypothetical protein
MTSLRDFVADDYRKNQTVSTIIPKGCHDYRKNQTVFTIIPKG